MQTFGINETNARDHCAAQAARTAFQTAGALLPHDGAVANPRACPRGARAATCRPCGGICAGAAPCRKAGALADEATAWCDARVAAGKLAGPKST